MSDFKNCLSHVPEKEIEEYQNEFLNFLITQAREEFQKMQQENRIDTHKFQTAIKVFNDDVNELKDD